MSHTLIPLHHYSVKVGHAVVDDDLRSLDNWKWRLQIPPSILKLSSRQPNVLIAILAEDPTALPRCAPIIDIGQGVLVHLSRVALRPEVVTILNELALHGRGSNPRKEQLLYEVTTIQRQIHRVVHLNKNKTDCRRDNLREVSNVDISTPDIQPL